MSTGPHALASATHDDDAALFRHLPGLRAHVTRAAIGRWPTPIEPLTGAEIPNNLWIKREDWSAEGYGGNKIRSIEFMIGSALRNDAGRIWSEGAFGSNHAVATATHARTFGLRSGALVFPQPPSETAFANARALAALDCEIRPLASVVTFPFGDFRLRRSSDTVQRPGAAEPAAVIGYVGAALEIADQIRAGVMPAPATIVVPVGSTGTISGLVAGIEFAAHMGLAFEHRPQVIGVRVTPWPVTSRFMVSRLAQGTAAFIAEHGGPDLRSEVRRVARSLRMTGAALGRGYGWPTPAGVAACRQLAPLGIKLDTTYSAKGAAWLLDKARHLEGPTLYWMTKSAEPLPEPTGDQLERMPRSVRRWLRRQPRTLGSRGDQGPAI